MELDIKRVYICGRHYYYSLKSNASPFPATRHDGTFYPSEVQGGLLTDYGQQNGSESDIHHFPIEVFNFE